MMADELNSLAAGRNENRGHGHVFKRPDGVRARCGGPGICMECARDLVQLHIAACRPDPETTAHPDDGAVDRFAAAMKAKLFEKRKQGRGGWDDKVAYSAAYLSKLLREHVRKGDPVDVGNLAMMLHQRGENIAPDPDPDITALQARVKELEEGRDAAMDAMRRCHNDGGFDREIGPIGCLLGVQCVCIGLYPIIKGAAS